jgi:hypothetical protein
MLIYSKYHTAVIVFATWVCGYFWDQSIPYFPIEISRTCTGTVSSQVFRWGTLSLFGTLWYENHVTHLLQWPLKVEMLSSPLIIWAWIVLISWFPDHTHNWTHIGCVLGMVFSVFLNVLLVGDVQRRLPIILCAMGIQGAGIALKGFCVLFTELDRSMFDWRVYWNVVWNIDHLQDQVYKQIMDIMFKSTDYAIVPHLTIPLFRVTGVMQWMALYLIMCLY